MLCQPAIGARRLPPANSPANEYDNHKRFFALHELSRNRRKKLDINFMGNIFTMLNYLKFQWNFLSRFYRVPTRILGMFLYNTYIYIFARPSMQFISVRLLHLAMNGVGYNNWWNLNTSGEENFLKVLEKFNPQIIIDVGANTGQYSKRALALTSAKIIAFEPLPKAFEQLLELENNNKERFFPIRKGVGIEDTCLDLFYGEADSPLASFSKEVNQVDFVGSSNINAMRVDVVSLDSFFHTFKKFELESIDLLKIDAEGFEYEVLMGAKNLIEKKIPKFIQIEFNQHQLFRGHTFYSIASKLIGYKAFRLLPFGSGLNSINPKSLDANIFCFANFVFIRDDVVAML
jgi:FkbM family methyltransferase